MTSIANFAASAPPMIEYVSVWPHPVRGVTVVVAVVFSGTDTAAVSPLPLEVMVGAAFGAPPTARSKLSDTAALPVSVAVTLTLIVPTSPLAGVPENAPVAALKLSQLGSALPLAKVADRVSVSPTSGSMKVLAGTVKANAAPCVAF